jgi:hypothetical protein
MSKWVAEDDERVIAVQVWAENHEEQYIVELVEEMTADEIAQDIQFTRSEEGAIKKFCKVNGLADPFPTESAPRASRSRKDDDNNWPYLNEREKATPPCPSCFTVPSLAGTCLCAA